jgi:putative transposase
MRRSQFTHQEIVHLLFEANAGVPVAEICRTSHVSLRTFYRWRQQFGGLTPQAVQQMKDLEAENRRLRALVSSLTTRLRDTDEKRADPPIRPTPMRGEFGAAAAAPGGLATRQREGVGLGRFAGVRVGG